MKKTHNNVLKLSDRGKTYSEIAMLTGYSTHSVYQIIKNRNKTHLFSHKKPSKVGSGKTKYTFNTPSSKVINIQSVEVLVIR